GAIKVEKSVAKVNPTLCKGCGTCVVECPAEAISMQNFSDEKLLAQVRQAAASWAKEGRPHAVAFVCNWSYNPDAEGFALPKNAHVIPVKCTGRVDPLLVLRAFLLGADGVLIIGCKEEDCHYVFGSPVAEQRAKQMKEWLEAVGIDPQRLLLEASSVGNEQHLDGVFKNFAAMLENIGSTPLKEALAQTKAAEG
ncbi:MAG TPA: hydrogenase iron-sulfur subunit, partial [Candidatus Paceibacterota bacterium]|nr:hydrogenase iron-sulfur subunit [Candidatus Paceibacterota bacterium]